MKITNSTPFSPCRMIRSAALSIAVAATILLLVMTALAMPTEAFAATHSKTTQLARAGQRAKIPQRAQIVIGKKKARLTAVVFQKRRPIAAAKFSRKPVIHAAHRPSRRVMASKVVFQPRPPTIGRAFGLHETPDILALRSSVAYIIDQNTSEPLFDKNSHAVVPIASISKLMTAMVVLDSKLPLAEQLEVSDADRDYEKNTSSRLAVGSVMSREDMLHIALMASENRAAAALSRYYPGGRPAFIAAMNAKAKSLGMNDTYFENSTGLSSHNVSSARDLVKMVNVAYQQYSLIRKFSTDRSYEVFTGKRYLSYHSTNALVRNQSWDIGLQKTGFINEAGQCLVMQAIIHGRPVVIVLLDSSGKYSRFADATRLRAWLDRGGEHLTVINTASNNGT